MLVGSVRGLKGQLVQQVSRGPARTSSLNRNRVIQHLKIGLEIWKENTVQCPLFLSVNPCQLPQPTCSWKWVDIQIHVSWGTLLVLNQDTQGSKFFDCRLNDEKVVYRRQDGVGMVLHWSQ